MGQITVSVATNFFEQLLELAELWTADATRPIVSAVYTQPGDHQQKGQLQQHKQAQSDTLDGTEQELLVTKAIAKEYVAFLSALKPFAFQKAGMGRTAQVTEKDRQAVQRWRVAVSFV